MSNPDILDQSKKRMELDKLRLHTQLLEKQHELNLDILQKQHSLNLKIHKKQSKLLKWSIVATIIAALLGTVLGHFLPTIEEYLMQKQKSTEHEKTSQLKVPIKMEFHCEKIS